MLQKSLTTTLRIKLDPLLVRTPVAVKDEIDYRLLSQSIRLEITEEVQGFVGRDMRDIVGRFISNKFEQWFALREKGASEAVNE